MIAEELYKRFGQSYFERVDFPLKTAIDKTAWTTHITSILGKSIAGLPIKEVKTLDGLKIITEGDSWLLLRPSGTEPLLRTYAEGSSPEIVKKLLAEAKTLADTPMPSPKKQASDVAKQKKKKEAAAHT